MEASDLAIQLVAEALRQGFSDDVLREQLRIATANLDPTEKFAVLANAWCQAVDTALDDHLLTDEEEARLATLKNALGVADALLDKNGHLTRLVKAAVLRDLQKGVVKCRCSMSAPLPFKLIRGEELLWAFPHVALNERIKKRDVIGGSSGFSIRLAKGIYWRIGGFRAVPRVREEVKQTDSGLFAITNKHLLFNGVVRHLKLPITGLATVEPFDSAIEVQRDSGSATPMLFLGLDGWFVYNAIQLC
ncbi:MAG TPA: hypothetical protein PLU30_14040 [Verrucomicrobiae bacterium]|nr:hypothetical protein [Verrucomicrobiae bacterium]